MLSQLPWKSRFYAVLSFVVSCVFKIIILLVSISPFEIMKVNLLSDVPQLSRVRSLILLKSFIYL